eukprot:scaffold94557_cov61-Phaeocystis_antarctica.AAC.4
MSAFGRPIRPASVACRLQSYFGTRADPRRRLKKILAPGLPRISPRPLSFPRGSTSGGSNSEQARERQCPSLGGLAELVGTTCLNCVARKSQRHRSAVLFWCAVATPASKQAIGGAGRVSRIPT